MKNITVALDDETYRRARMIAAERDTSVSALVKQFLNALASGESEFEHLRHEEQAFREQINAFRRPGVARGRAQARGAELTHFFDTNILPYSTILSTALEIQAAHGFSYWDCAIIAAARALGCRELYTEDMAHGRRIDGVVIVNPLR